MKILTVFGLVGGLLGSAAALAHGQHAEAPAGSMLHVLVHNWPLLLVAIAASGGYLALHRRR